MDYQRRGAQDVHLDFHTALNYGASGSLLLNYQRRGAQDVHLDFHTAPEL